MKSEPFVLKCTLNTGEVPERSKGHAWKACVRLCRTEGSNPSLSANKQKDRFSETGFFVSEPLFPGAFRRIKRTEPIPRHPDIHPYWLSLWPIFSVTILRKHAHQVLLLRLCNPAKTTGYMILSWLVRFPISLPKNVSGKLSRLLMGSPVGHQKPNSFRCSSHNWGNGDIKSARVRVAGCVLLRILSCMSGASSIRRRTREA